MLVIYLGNIFEQVIRYNLVWVRYMLRAILMWLL